MALQGIEAPTQLELQYFLGNADDFGSFLKSSRFIVRILPAGSSKIAGLLSSYGRDLMYLCEAAEMPGRGFESIDVRYYGPNQKFPFQTRYEDINLTFICRSGGIERKIFDDWLQIIHPTNSFNFEYKENYRSTIDIFQYNDLMIDMMNPDPEPIYSFTLKDAFPILVNPQPVTWADAEFLRLAVTFTYTSWSRKGIDKEPGSGYEFTGLVANRATGQTS